MSEVIQWIFIVVICIGQVMVIDMISKHTAKIKELNNCKSNILTNTFKLSEDILALKKQYEILKENVKAIEDDLAGFVGPINEFEDYTIKELNKLKTDLNFIESKVTGNTEAVDDLNKYVTIIENKVNENTRLLDTLRDNQLKIRTDLNEVYLKNGDCDGDDVGKIADPA